MTRDEILGLLQAAGVLDALTAEKMHVIQEGTVPPWMERVLDYDDPLGGIGPLYRLRLLTNEAPA